MASKPKVLISAYACSPSEGSEAGVGWGFITALAPKYDLWVITEEEKYRSAIESYLRGNPGELNSVRFYFIRKQRERTLRKIWPPSYYWFYRRWHADALKLARRLHAEVGFDLAHQLTMIGYREPGFLWRLNLPFVWGPIAGMNQFPWRFLHTQGLYGCAFHVGRNIINALQMRYHRRAAAAAQRASAGLITATQPDWEGARKRWGCDSLLLSEVGVVEPTAKGPRERLPTEPLRIIWSGQHLPRKALNIGIRALALLPRRMNWELHILGSGVRTRAWKRLAARMGVRDRCVFHGWVSRDTATEVMASGHLMLITSLSDATSTVTVEALAAGLPVLAFDHCGFSNSIDASCGIKIPVTTPRDAVERFARVIAYLFSHEEQRVALATGALRRSKDYLWSRKAEIISGVYERMLHPMSEQNDEDRSGPQFLLI